MERIQVDGSILSWELESGAARLEIDASSGPTAPFTSRSAFRLTSLNGRLSIGMALLPTSRVIDISIQPGVMQEVLPIGEGSCAPGSSGSVAARWIARLAERSSAWRPMDPDAAGLIRTCGGATFPLLGAAYDHGASPVREIPRWAATLLAQPTAREAAVVAFSDKATRPVTSALAEGLVQTDGHVSTGVQPSADAGHREGRQRVSLLGIGLSLMSEPVLEPDQLARILCHDCSHHGSDTWPTKEQIATFRQFAPKLGSARVERLMRDAASRADGPQLMSQLIETLDSVGHLLPRRIASPLDELYLQCQSLLPVDPNPGLQGLQPLRGRGSQPQVPRQARRRDPSPPRAPATTHLRAELPETPTRPVHRQIDPRRRALLAPRASQPTSSNRLASQDLNLTTAIDNVCLEDGLCLHVPRSTAELEAWGRRLGNCLGSYGRAVTSGRSVIVGVELHGILTYCLEVAPNRSIRQFLGIRNRPVPPTHSAIVCTHLVLAGVLDPHNVANAPWLPRGTPDGVDTY